jgi:hypothetical protein
MKNLLSVFAVVLLLPFGLKGQNLVPNGNFENYTSCPSGWGQTYLVSSWFNFHGTPDYFNSCSNSFLSGVSVPINHGGYQPASNGSGYAGFYVAPKGYGEILCTPIQKLKPGKGYKVSMAVNKANAYNYAMDNFGVYFFYSSSSTPSLKQDSFRIAQLVSYSDYGFITDTSNWVHMSKTFIADTAFNYLAISTWDANSKIAHTGGYTNTVSYYYVDSVLLTTYDTFYIKNVSNLKLCNNEKFYVSYFSSDRFDTLNMLTVQLSDKNGNFLNSNNIGTKSTKDNVDSIACLIPYNIPNGSNYKIRVVSSNHKDTSQIYSIPIDILNLDSMQLTINTNSPICQGSSINFSTSSIVNPQQYLWRGPNSFSTTNSQPFIANAMLIHSGKYYTTLKFNSCEVNDTFDVIVKPTPATPTATNNGPICEGEPLNLSGFTATTGVTYSWTGPNSYTSGSQNPTITNTTTAMSGNYIVTATLDGCSSSATTTVLVNPMPAAVTVSSNSPVCEGSTLQLSSTASTTGATYNWTGPNSFTANTQNSSVSSSTTAATGWYKMNVDLNGCVYKDSVLAAVNPIPATPVITYNSPLCAGETLTLNGGNISGGTYSWTGANNYTSAQSIATRTNMQTADAGIYKANVTVNGCTSPEGTVTVNLNPAPFVVIFSNPTDSICQGDPAMFIAIPNNHGGTPAYQWLVNNQPVATGLTYTTTTLNDQDVIRCDMTENTKCSVPYKDASNEITMTVLPWLAPTVSITANPTTPLKENQYVTFTAVPVNAGVFPTYQWKRNGQNIVGATGNTWSANTLNDNDDISVVITSSYKCPQPVIASSNSIKVRVLTGVNDIDVIAGVSLYPNPNRGSFTLKGTFAGLSKEERLLIEVINSLGQVVYKGAIEEHGQDWEKEIVLDAPSGIYLLRLHADNDSQSLKFNIE